jgi:hypothetical protein
MMTIAGDTNDLVSTGLWGEEVMIVRNTPTYDDNGFPTDSWDMIVDTVGEIQRIPGNNPTRDLGQGRISSHAIFLPNATDVIQGDRLRSSDWDSGKAEYDVQSVRSDEGHVEIRTRLVRSSTLFLMLEHGTWLRLETGKGLQLE